MLTICFLMMTNARAPVPQADPESNSIQPPARHHLHPINAMNIPGHQGKSPGRTL